LPVPNQLASSQQSDSRHSGDNKGNESSDNDENDEHRPNKLKPSMMTLSGHSCIKLNAPPLPIHSKRALNVSEQDAEYVATDDFAEFEEFEEFGSDDDANQASSIAPDHTPPSFIPSNSHSQSLSQSQSQSQYSTDHSQSTLAQPPPQ